ncbi:hypothetical protein LO771_09910 [Streptacidiphilus sp. ASG 303]|uniref:hypothetical protein n=1 Tax=Streptacidiphilus sp. ASG 303 TaxID=2896847 RepID=UPI001E361985|nr:hypothetical protein [Streptacidiphilus sp. ASG 303]MCD0482708.1 hypothetical protein [Streptacidiphilus sp. ASG 303]
MEAVGIVVGVIALLVLGLLALLAVAAVKAGRAVGRKVEEHGDRARRAVEDAALKARKYTQAGPQGRIAALRLEVRESLTATRRMLESGVGADPQLGDALQLLARLDEHARALDGELRLLEREPGAPRVDARLPELRERAGRLTHAAESLRWAAQDRAHHFSDSDLARLGRECETEAGALRHWAPAAPPAPGAPEPASAPAPAPADAAGPRPRRGISAGRAPSAADALGLADRLRKPRPEPGAPTAG